MATPTVSPKRILSRIAENGLLSRETLAELRSELTHDRLTKQKLESCLVGPQRLTAFQYRQLLGGGRLRLGKYILLDQVGSGGMGRVYRGFHPILRRDAALKVLRRTTADDNSVVSTEQLVRRFQREMESLAKLRHPRIAIAYDAGSEGDDFYLAMELIEGVDLARLVDREGPLPIDLACQYAVQVLETLDYAHQVGLIHRDIKPSNIIVGPDGIKLLDFGLASFIRNAAEHTQLTETGGILGTPDFLAPEQARNAKQATPTADQYGVGATLYYLLTGEPPFPGGSCVEKILKHQTQPAPPPSRLRPDTPKPLDEIILRLLDKDPGSRFASASEAAGVLRQHCTNNHESSSVEVARNEQQTHSLRPTQSVSDQVTRTEVIIEPDDRQLQPIRSVEKSRRQQDSHWKIVLMGLCVLVFAGGAMAVYVSSNNHSSTLASSTKQEATTGSERDFTVANPLVEGSVLLEGDDRLAAAGSPYLVDTVRLRSNRGDSKSPESLIMAFAWADWENSNLPASVIILDVLGDSPPTAINTNGPIKSLALHPDEDVLAAACGHYNHASDGTVSLWDISEPTKPKFIRELKGHDGGNAQAIWYADDQLLTLRSRESQNPVPLIQIWDTSNGELIVQTIEEKRGASTTILLPANQSLLIGEYPNRLTLWDIRDWTVRWMEEIDESCIYDFCMSADEQHVIITAGGNDGSGGAIYLFNLIALKLKRLWVSPSDVTDLELMDDKRHVTWVTADGQRCQAELHTIHTQAVEDVVDLDTMDGWKWFHRTDPVTNVSVVGGLGSSFQLIRPKRKLQTIDLNDLLDPANHSLE